MNQKKKLFSGYTVFAGCLLLMIFPGGLLSYTSGLFMYPICQEFGFSVTAFSISNTFAAGVNALVSVFLVQYLSKGKRGTMKIIMALSAVVTCGGFALMSRCTQLWQFYAMSCVWSLGYNMLTFTPVGMLMGNWFIKNRATMTGIAFAGGNMGGAIFSTVVSQIMANQGWRFAYVFGGSLSFVAVVIALFLIKRSPAEYGQNALGAGEPIGGESGEVQVEWQGLDKKTAMKTPALYMICAAMFLTGLYAAGIANHVVNFLCTGTWEIGAAGLVMTVFTLFGILGNSGGGAFVSKVGMKKALLVGISLLVVSVACLALAPFFPPLAYIWAALQGTATFVGVLIPTLVVSSTFGSKDFAGIYGFAYAFYLVGCAVSGPFVAMIADASSYTVAWIVLCLLIVVLGILHAKCQAYSSKFKEQYPN